MENKKRKGLFWIVPIVLVVIGVALYMVYGRSSKSLQISTREATERTVDISVMATGTIQPVDKVEVGTQVSGIVQKIYVDFNSRVKKGELLAELDKLTLIERVNQAEASVTSAKSDLNYAQQNFDRTKQLFESKAATQVSYEEAVNRLAQAKTALTNAQANLHQNRVNLSYASITSPIDGVVLNRAVEQGQTVAASFNTPTLFTIANDLTKMQVEANVDEADIGKVRVGQRVSFYVDAFPNDVFPGTVNQVRLEPVVTSNVVTYTVIIEAPNPEQKLFPGMTANITVYTDEQSGVVVPVEAIYFTMTPEIAKEMKIAPPALPENGMKEKGLWVKTGETFEHRNVETGLQDGVNIVITSGLNAGEEVLLSATMESGKAGNQAVRNPLMPSRRPGQGGSRQGPGR